MTGSSGHVYFWDEAIGEVIWEFPTGPGTQEVVRGRLDGRLVLENDTRPGGGLHYFFRDHLGSTQVTADYFTGASVCSSYFHPFGQSADSTGCDVHTRKFTGKERDPESGLDYFGARYYDSTMGRFASPDPLLDSATHIRPQSWNRYTYALDNPTRYFDPTGQAPQDGGEPDMTKRTKEAIRDAWKGLATYFAPAKTGEPTPADLMIDLRCPSRCGFSRLES